MSENEILNVLVTASLKGCAILAAALLITTLWRSASAAAKHLVWTIAIAVSVAMPLLAATLKFANAPVIPVTSWTVAPRGDQGAITPAPAAAHEPAAAISMIDAPENEMSIPPVAELQHSSLIESVVPETRRPWRPSLLSVWLTGVIVSLVPFLVAILRLRKVVKSSRSARDNSWNRLIESTPAIAHISGKVRIVESDTAAMPMTWGIIRPTLLVPSSASRWPEWQRRNVLLHELAHVERRDCLTQLLAQVACSLYWFNPLMWVAAHRMRVERELACDDRVITAGAKASDYATNLLEVARSLRAPAFTSQSAIAMARPTQLSGRLLAVLDSGRNRRSVTRRIAFAAVVTAVAAAIPLAALTPRAEAATVTSQVPAVIAAVQVPTAAIAPSGSEEITVGQPVSGPSAVTTQALPCTGEKGDGASTSITSQDGDMSYRVKLSNKDCSFELRADGKFTLRPDLSDFESISSDGWIRIEAREGSTTRRMEIRPGSNGSLDHQYWVNGDRAPYDNAARAWLATTLLAVERRAAFAANTRVPQLYKSGGVNGVLNEISQMGGDYARARYFGTLLDMDNVSLNTNDLNNVVRRAASDLTQSDYYMAEVLGKLGNQRAANETTWQIFAETSGKMKSDYYRASLIKDVLKKGRLSNETVGTLLRSASGLKSDYYLSDLLKSIASQYALNASTRQYYADALRHIESDYYRADLLGSLGSGEWDARTSDYVLQSIAEMKSDYYRSESLTRLVRDNHVNDWNTYFKAATSIPSDYYKKTVLVAALRQAPLTKNIVLGVLNSVPQMKSGSEAAEVLKAVTDRYRIDDSLRSAYEKAADSIDSDYYRGAAYAALRRAGS